MPFALCIFLSYPGPLAGSANLKVMVAMMSMMSMPGTFASDSGRSGGTWLSTWSSSSAGCNQARVPTDVTDVLATSELLAPCHSGKSA